MDTITITNLESIIRIIIFSLIILVPMGIFAILSIFLNVRNTTNDDYSNTVDGKEFSSETEMSTDPSWSHLSGNIYHDKL